ncbi:MAG: DUF721 domain-containing protein [Elusimicrobia bacterium]|nr:DUF721 domain-containing protein [Candidatus Liberimonas magnetica]
MAFTQANAIVNIIKNQLGLNEKTYTVIRVWDKEIGPMSKYASLAAVKKGKLIVEVSSSSVFQEMTLRKTDIIKKINQYFGKEKVVKDIKFELKK